MSRGMGRVQRDILAHVTTYTSETLDRRLPPDATRSDYQAALPAVHRLAGREGTMHPSTPFEWASLVLLVLAGPGFLRFLLALQRPLAALPAAVQRRYEGRLALVAA